MLYALLLLLLKFVVALKCSWPLVVRCQQGLRLALHEPSVITHKSARAYTHTHVRPFESEFSFCKQ